MWEDEPFLHINELCHKDKMKKLLIIILGIAACLPVLSQGSELLPIVYSDSGGLCSVSHTGGAIKCVKSKKEYGSPSWQPKGSNIVAESGYHDGAHNLELLKNDGTAIRRLHKSSEFIRPVWSQDGRYIYGLSYSQPRSIRRWDSEGKKFVDIPVRGAEAEYKYLQMISFDPSHKRAVILLDHFKKMLLVTVHDDHFQAIKIIPKDYSYVSESVWLDENNLIFIGKKNDKRGELWKLNVDSEKIQMVGVPGLWLRDTVTLSPDRKSVIVCAMSDDDKTKWSLWRYSLGSPRAERITTGTEDVSPSWRH
jgi:hypothetical protein